MMDEKQPLLSVIVPVYNTEKFLRKCIDSIINQTYKNLEIIIVNDCSAEGENVIIDEYMKIDKRVKSIRHEENKGLFQARITGMEAAKGEYFAFVDSDDRISIDFYRLLIKKASETNSDMIIADFANEYEDGRQEYYNLDPIRLQDLNLEGEQVLETFMKQQGLFFAWHTVWNKIYSMELWKQGKIYLKDFSNKAGHLIMTEDIAYSCVFWSLAKKVTNVHNIYYFYARHEKQSTVVRSLEKFKKNVTDGYKVFEFLKEILILFKNWEKFEKNYDNYKNLYIKYWSEDCKKIQIDFIEGETFILDLLGIEKLRSIEKDDIYFDSLTTDFSKEFSWYESIKKAIIRENTEYVSFDIFDTLVLRPLFYPSDLFKFLNFEFNILINSSVFIEFSAIRIYAEQSVREAMKIKIPSFEDVTLDEIYQYIKDNYSFDESITEYMKQREIELEFEFCTLRNTGKELYELAKYTGKKIIFTSDMYLSADVVNKILEKNGYKGELYLSSELRLLKGTGNLYRYILEELNIMSDKIIHIGDNWESDIEAARKVSIEPHFIPKTQEQFTGTNPGIYSGESYSKIFGLSHNNIDCCNPDGLYLGMRCMFALAANKIFDNPFIQPFNTKSDFNANPRYIGYYALGMHLYAVTDWLIDNVKDKNIDTLHFIARDGYLPQKAYKIMASENMPKTDYIYITRKSILPSTIAGKNDIYSLLKTMPFQIVSPERFLNSTEFLINKENFKDIKNICKENGYIFSKNFMTHDSFLQFVNLYREKLLDKEAVNNYKNKFTDFFNKKIKENDVLFDLGYSGRNELLLSKVLKTPVNCFYIHTNSDDCDLRSALGNFRVNTFYDFRPKMCVVIREHLFSKLEPSCVRFDVDSDDFKPVFEEYNHNYQTDFVTKIIQNAALDFVSDMENIFGKYKECVAYKKLCASMPYEFLMESSNEFDMKIFSSSYFEDDMLGGRNINFFDFWQKEKSINNYGRIVAEKVIELEKVIEVKTPIRYEDFLEGKPKWKKAAFMWMFDKKLFKENIQKRTKKK